MLDVRGLTAGYGKKEVLHDLSVRLEAGKLTAIIGPNGCGKSTLLKAVLGLIPRAEGEVVLDGVSFSTLRRQEIARRIAYLAQGASIPDMIVEELVLRGRFPYLSYPRGYTQKDRELARLAMERVGIAALAREPMSALSGGLRQTAYIAMALAQGTDSILLDEPTTYLDVAHQLALMKLLRQLSAEGRGITAVMHDLPLALNFADTVAVMAEGKIVMVGTPREIAASGVIGTVFGVEVMQTDGEYWCRMK